MITVATVYNFCPLCTYAVLLCLTWADWLQKAPRNMQQRREIPTLLKFIISSIRVVKKPWNSPEDKSRCQPPYLDRQHCQLRLHHEHSISICTEVYCQSLTLTLYCITPERIFHICIKWYTSMCELVSIMLHSQAIQNKSIKQRMIQKRTLALKLRNCYIAIIQ